jgi:hypothetical protein
MMQDYQIREYSETDIQGILKLFEQSFQQHASEPWFRWKYQDSPWGSRGYVGVRNDHVVAFYGGIRFPFVFEGKSMWAYQLCDVMTHPEHRGRLISKTPLVVKLGELLYRENPMDFAFGFPSQRHARLQALRLGGKGFRLVRSYKKEPLQRSPLSRKLTVQEGWEHLKGKKIDAFLHHHDRTVLQIAKKERYVRWRYIAHPARKYRLLVFSRFKIIRGYVVFTVQEDWFNMLEILMKHPGDAGDMLSSLELYLAQHMNHVKGIRAWVHPEENLRMHMDSHNYTYEDSIPVAFKPVKSDCDITPDIFYKRYFYRMGDYDAS